MRHVLVAAALLVLFSTMMIGCHASGDVDTNSSTQVGLAH